MGPSKTPVNIEITYADNFRRKVCEEGDADPFGYLKVTVGESYLVGSDETHVGLWLSEDLARLLRMSEALAEDTKTVLTFRNGPSYLVVEPHGETVGLTHCLHLEGVEDPDEHWEMEETYTVSKRAWITELLDVSESYYEDIVELNPDLETSEFVRELKAEIGNTKNRLEEIAGE